MRRSTLLFLALAGTAVAFNGCGGGSLSQEDMRRAAIRRPKDSDDEDSSAPVVANENVDGVGADKSGDVPGETSRPAE